MNVDTKLIDIKFETIVLNFFLPGPFINPEHWFFSLCLKLQLHVYTYMPHRLLETMGSRLKVLKYKTEDLWSKKFKTFLKLNMYIQSKAFFKTFELNLRGTYAHTP